MTITLLFWFIGTIFMFYVLMEELAINKSDQLYWENMGNIAQIAMIAIMLTIGWVLLVPYLLFGRDKSC